MKKSCENCIHRRVCKKLLIINNKYVRENKAETCEHYINLYLYNRKFTWRVRKHRIQRDIMILDEKRFEEFLKSRGIKFHKTKDSYILERPIRIG